MSIEQVRFANEHVHIDLLFPFEQEPFQVLDRNELFCCCFTAAQLDCFHNPLYSRTQCHHEVPRYLQQQTRYMTRMQGCPACEVVVEEEAGDSGFELVPQR